MSRRPQAATIYAVAELARVSIATVSRVLQGSSVVTEKTRQKVLAAVRELDYLPSGAARSLAGPPARHLRPGPARDGRPVLRRAPRRLRDPGGRAAPERHARPRRAPRATVATPCAPWPPASTASPSSAPTLERVAQQRQEVVARRRRRPTRTSRSSPPRTSTAPGGSPTTCSRTADRLLFVGDPDAAHDVLERHAGFVPAHQDRGLQARRAGAGAVPRERRPAVAERILAGDLEADALVCSNDELALAIMARLVDAGIDVPGRHRRRRLGRRDDGPLRPARASPPSASPCGRSGPWPPTASTPS